MNEKECQRRRGRRRSHEEVEQLVAAFEASGLTYRQFAERNGVCVSALARYVRRYRWHQKSSSDSGQWVAVEIAESRAVAGELVLVLRGERRIEVRRGFDAATLRELVQALEQI